MPIIAVARVKAVGISETVIYVDTVDKDGNVNTIEFDSDGWEDFVKTIRNAIQTN